MCDCRGSCRMDREEDDAIVAIRLNIGAGNNGLVLNHTLSDEIDILVFLEVME